MSGSGPAASRLLGMKLRAGDVNARRQVAAALRNHGTLTAAAEALGVGRRMLERVIAEEPTLDERPVRYAEASQAYAAARRGAS